MRFGFFKKIAQKVDQIVTGRGRIDEALFDELEELMIQSDVNIHTTTVLMAGLRDAVQENRMATTGQVMAHLKSHIAALLAASGGENGTALRTHHAPPTVYLIVGVNGVGKDHHDCKTGAPPAKTA